MPDIPPTTTMSFMPAPRSLLGEAVLHLRSRDRPAPEPHLLESDAVRQTAPHRPVDELRHELGRRRPLGELREFVEQGTLERPDRLLQRGPELAEVDQEPPRAELRAGDRRRHR